MCNYFWKLYKTTNQTEDHWSEVCKQISGQAKLHLMSCLQLASKLDSHSKHLGISQVHTYIISFLFNFVNIGISSLFVQHR